MQADLTEEYKALRTRVLFAQGDLLGWLLSQEDACFAFTWPCRPCRPHGSQRRVPLEVWVRAVDDPITRYFAKDVLALDPCAYCGGEVECIDHIQPVARDGRDHWENYVGACRRCNFSKNATSLLRFLLRRATT